MQYLDLDSLNSTIYGFVLKILLFSSRCAIYDERKAQRKFAMSIKCENLNAGSSDFTAAIAEKCLQCFSVFKFLNRIEWQIIKIALALISLSLSHDSQFESFFCLIMIIEFRDVPNANRTCLKKSIFSLTWFWGGMRYKKFSFHKISDFMLQVIYVQ